MSTRRSIDVEGFSHGGLPIPAASRKGPLVITGGVHGLSNAPGATNELADQVPRMFDNLRRILEAAGATFDDVVRMTVYVRNGEVRAAVNGPWVAAFPDAASRPARHTLVNEQLPAPMLVQCDATAYVAGGE